MHLSIHFRTFNRLLTWSALTALAFVMVLLCLLGCSTPTKAIHARPIVHIASPIGPVAITRADLTPIPQRLTATADMSNRHALLYELQSRGASEKTARAEKMRQGVTASERMAAMDEVRLLAHRALFIRIAKRHMLPPALLAAIASRETRGGRHLRHDGFSIYGGNRGFGIMQVDARFHRIVGGPTSAAHIDQAAQILVRFRKRLERRFPQWTAAQHLKGAVAAYNCGPSRVTSAKWMDRSTTGGDYSDDTWARARFLASLFEPPVPIS